MSSEITHALVLDAIQNGIEPPDVVAEMTGSVAQQSTDDIDWVGFVSPPELPPGSRGIVVFIVQNAKPFSCNVRILLEIKEHPNFFSKKIDLPSEVTVNLDPLQVVLVKVPFWVMNNAGKGEYIVGIDVYTKSPEGEGKRRLRPKQPNRKAKTNWGGLIAKNVVGLGLAATTGLGFYSIPRSYNGVRFSVNPLAHCPQQLPENVKIDLVWSVDDWNAWLSACVIAKEQWAAFHQELGFAELVPFAWIFVTRHLPFLDEGQCAAVAFSIAANVSMMFGDKLERTESRGIEWFREAIMNSPGGDTTSRLQEFVNASANASLFVAALGSVNRFLSDMSLDRAAEQKLARDSVAELLAGTISPKSFWMLWGLDGIFGCRKLAPALLQKFKSPIVASTILTRRAIGEDLVALIFSVFPSADE